MNITQSNIPGLFIIEPKIFGDERGFFLETWNRERYRACGISETFVQDNISLSTRGTLRGLHYQRPPYGQGKLVSVLEGTVLDIALDIRKSSPTFGKYSSVILDGTTKRQFFIPPGFAHGFAVLSPNALFHYKCTELYHPESERTILWNDPELAIDWQLQTPLLSPKDRNGTRLRDIPAEDLFE